MNARLAGLVLLLATQLLGCQSASAPPTPAPRTATRIVSVTPSLTEILFAIGAGERVVGVTLNDRYPPDVARLPKVGDLNLDYEALLRLKPDAVVLDPALGKQQRERLLELKVPLVELPTATLEDLRTALRRLGQLAGREEEAMRLLSELETRLEVARQRGNAFQRRPRVFIEVWNRPLMTTGAGTYMHELVDLCGGDNVYAEGEGTWTITAEDLISRNPDIVILTTSTVEEARDLPGFSLLDAVRKGQLHKIDADLLVRPTPRVVKALDLLEQWFSKTSPG